MPSTLRYEGSDLDELLLEVRAAYGPNPRIIEANKLRRGGLAGFFAKEQYEVVIELDGRGPVQIDARLDLTGTGRNLESSADGPMLPPVAHAAQAARGAQTGSRSRDRGTEAANRSREPADPPTMNARRAFPAGRSVSAWSAGTGSAGTGSAGTGSAGDADATTRTAHEEAILRQLDRQAETARRATASGGLATQRPSFDSMLDRMAKDAGVSPARWSDTNLPAPVPARHPERHSGSVARKGPASPSPLPPRAQRALRTLGVPYAWLCDPAIPRTGARLATIAHIMKNVAAPEPIPTGAGVVLAVVGSISGALHSAREIAAEMGIDPSNVCVVSVKPRDEQVPLDCWLSDLASIRQRRDRWRRSLTPSLVVVDSSLARHESAKARQLLRVLEPTLSWGVVEATRKSADVLNWAERMGGLDALVVTDVDATVSPAAVLSAGIPVARIDGRIATSVTWTGLLNDRLTDLIARKK